MTTTNYFEAKWMQKPYRLFHKISASDVLSSLSYSEEDQEAKNTPNEVFHEELAPGDFEGVSETLPTPFQRTV